MPRCVCLYPEYVSASTSGYSFICLISTKKFSLGEIMVQREFYNNMHIVILSGEGNGTPLQYSCLENPMDGGAW